MRLIVAVFILLFVMSGNAQTAGFPESKMAVVVEPGNNHTIGELIGEDDQKIVLRVKGKERKEFRKSTLSFYKVLDENDLVLRGEYMFPTSGQTTYLFSTTAFTLEDQRLSINGAYLSYTDVQIPLSTTADLGIGTVLGAPLSITGKKKYALGSSLTVGVKGYGIWGSYIDPGIGLFAGQGLITNGRKERNFTIGPGIGVGVDYRETIGILFSTFGLKSRISQKLSIVADGFFAREFNSTDLIGVFAAMGGIHYHAGKTMIWSGGIGVIGLQEMTFNFWGTANLDTFAIPMIYIGFRKTWLGGPKRKNVGKF